MKKYIYLMLSLVMVSMLGACSKDNPFDIDSEKGTGKLLTASLKVRLATDGPRNLLHRGVRFALPAVNDFTVEFIDTESGSVVREYNYAEMPEIVTLPVGHYTAKAYYGENPAAAFDAPYYCGESEEFEIELDKITDEVAPIECKISNVRVSIEFEPELRAAIDNNAVVTVKVGETGSLNFTVADVEAGRSGYFAYAEGSHTLAATFVGKVQGYDTTETNTYDDVQPGNHYTIRFKLHDAASDGPGAVTGKEEGLVKIDAVVVKEDMSRDVDSGEQEIVDDMRPQDNPKGPDTPDTPDTPDNPGKDGSLTITTVPPVSFDKVNEISEIVENGYDVKLTIKTDAAGGITKFTVKIQSNTLSEQVLTEVGLSSNLDLVNPGSAEEMLRGLPLPVKEQVLGQKEVVFDVTPFMEILQGVAQEPDTHSFTLTVEDADGNTLVKTIVFHNN